MSFSKQAIGFYLQLEDQLTPVLRDAGRAYDRFVKHIDKSNTKAFTAARKGMTAMTGLAEKFQSALPGKTTAFKMNVEVNVTAKSMKKTSAALVDAVSKAMGKMKLRLSASVPAKRSSMFDNKVGLRAAYRQQVQPPDMEGWLGAPGFAKGTEITGGKGKNIDDVKAYLAKGEMVLPADSAAQLKALAGTARDAGGAFIQLPQALADSISEMQTLLKATDRLQEASKAGLDPKAPAKLKVAYAALTKQQKIMTVAASGLHISYKGKIAPMMNELADKIDAIGDASQKQIGPVEKLFSKVLGPVRFLAMNEAMKNLQENFLQVKSAMESVGSETGLDRAADGLVTNFYSMNKILQKTPEEMDAFRAAFLKANEKLPFVVRNVADLTEAMETLLEQGAGESLMMGLYQPVSLFAKATGVAREEAAKLAMTLTTKLGMSASEATDQMARFAKIASAAQISPDRLVAGIDKLTESSKAYLMTLNPQAAAKALDTMSRIVAGAEAMSSGAGEDIAGIIGGALTDPDKMKALSGIGIDRGQLETMLATGEIDGFFQKMQAMPPVAAEAFAKAFDLTGDTMLGLTKQTEIGNAAIARTKTVAVEAGKGLDVLADRAANTMSWYQRMKESVGGALTSIGAVNTSLEILKDINPVAIFSFIYLFKEFAPLKFAAGVAKLGAAFVWLKTGLLALVPAVWSFTVALLACPITWLVAGIAGLIGLIYYFREEIAFAAKWWWDLFVVGIQAGVSLISGHFQMIVDGFMLVKDGLTAAWDGVTNMFTSKLDALKGYFETVKGWFNWFGDDAANTTINATGVQGFATGGQITSGAGRNIDDVLAMLAKGEMVIPAAHASNLQAMANNFHSLPSAPISSPSRLDTVSKAPRMQVGDETYEVLVQMLDVQKQQLSEMRRPQAGPAARRGGPMSDTTGGIAKGRY